MIDQESLRFAWEHRHEDATHLLLQQHPGINLRAAAQQIEGWQTARTKWPTLSTAYNFLYPPRLNREQSSSETTANYKTTLLAPFHKGADLTGGMGIDTIALAAQATHFDYIEQDDTLCQLAEHNFQTLGKHNIQVHHGDAIEWISHQPAHFDLLYIDPARRSDAGRKVVAFEQCSPNLLPHTTLLLNRSKQLLIKASPMIDIPLAVKQLGCVEEVHIVAVKGECREVLFLCGQERNSGELVCVNLKGAASNVDRFPLQPAQQAAAPVADAIGKYLYEPHAALMKAGTFGEVGRRYGVGMLDRNSHFYTAQLLVANFPGRIFEVVCQLSLSPKEVRRILPERKAHVVARNYPVGADALRTQLGIKEGGDAFIIATSMVGRRVGLLCRLLDC